jgi:hypothetical protein
MKFWDTEESGIDYSSLYQSYLKATNPKSKKDVLLKLMDEYPNIIEYLWNRADTCFGQHSVYLIKINYKGKSYLKVGYTKNSIKDRFLEKRYTDRNEFTLVDIIREVKLQALGAVCFEKEIKRKVDSIKTEMKMPGKGEIFDTNKLNELLDTWNKTLPKFKTIVGLKSPN